MGVDGCHRDERNYPKNKHWDAGFRKQVHSFLLSIRPQTLSFPERSLKPRSVRLREARPGTQQMPVLTGETSQDVIPIP
jgi:hypothetical protein